MSAEREIGYIKGGVCQPPSAPIWRSQLCCVWGATGRSSSTPNPWIKAKSYSAEIYVLPRENPLWMWERAAQWVFLGVIWKFLGLEWEQAGEDFISTLFYVCFFCWGKKPHNHHSVFFHQGFGFTVAPGCYILFASLIFRGGRSQKLKANPTVSVTHKQEGLKSKLTVLTIRSPPPPKNLKGLVNLDRKEGVVLNSSANKVGLALLESMKGQ